MQAHRGALGEAIGRDPEELREQLAELWLVTNQRDGVEIGTRQDDIGKDAFNEMADYFDRKLAAA